MQPADDPEAEVSLVSADLERARPAASPPRPCPTPKCAPRCAKRPTLPRRQAPALPPQMLLARTMQAPSLPSTAVSLAPLTSPFSGIEVRMVEENVTIVPKDEVSVAQETPDEKVHTVVRGQTIEQIVRASGGTPAQARAVSSSLKDRPLTENQRLRLLFAAMEPGAPRQLVRVMIYGEEQIEGIAAIDDRGVFVSVAPPSPAAAPSDDDDDEDSRTGLALYNSIYETALKNDIPRALIDDLIRIVSADSDTDFQRPVSGGDSIDLFYAEEEEGEAREILHVSLTAAGETKRYYRFANPEDNTVDYFDENGRSAKKFLMRKPVAAGELRSGFGFPPPSHPRLFEAAFGRRLRQQDRNADPGRRAPAP